jgi:outer membrane lipoprotein-sorting protein
MNRIHPFTRFFFPLFLFFVFASPCNSAQQQVYSLVKSLQEKFSHAKSLEGDFSLTLHGLQNASGPVLLKANGRVFVLDTNLRMETIMHSIFKNGKQINMHVLFLFKDNTLWEKAKMLSSDSENFFLGKMDANALMQAFPQLFHGNNFLDFLNPAAGVTQLNPEKTNILGEAVLGVDKTKTVLLESPPWLLSQALNFPIQTDNPTIASIHMWVGTENGISYQTTLVDKNGKTWMRFVFTRLRVNPRLSPGLFLFSPPKDAQVIDLTPFMIELFRKTLQGMEKGAKTP